MEIDALIEEYADIEEEKQVQSRLMNNDSDITALKSKLGGLEETAEALKREIEVRSDMYLRAITLDTDRQSKIKAQIAEKWNVPGKTYESSIATVTLRVTKSLIVGSKEKIIEVLAMNNKLLEGVSKFDLRLLRKFKEVGLLPDDAARFEESRNVAIKIGRNE